MQAVIRDLVTRIRDLGRNLRNACRRDKKDHLRALAADVDAADAQATHSALRRLLRPKKFRRGGHAPLPVLRRPDESLCQNASEVQAEWRRHFADLEGGVTVDGAKLVRQCLVNQKRAFESLAVEELPDLDAVVQIVRKVQPAKAAGPDLLPPSICKRFACPLGVLVWPIILKTIVFCSEPAGYKGGTLFHIPKAGQGGCSKCTAERGILVQPILGKILHKAMRGTAMQAFERRATPLQIGGRRGLSFLIGCFCSRGFLQLAKDQGRSAGILFCDLAAAYYSVVRELLVGGGLVDASLEDITASLGLNEDDLKLLRCYVDDDAIITDEDGEGFLCAIAREIHSATWFWIHSDDQIVMTRRGTRPGSCWADVLFSILFAKVLERRGDFDQIGCRPIIPWSGCREPVLFDARKKGAQEVAVLDVVYADDIATCVIADTPAELPRAVQMVAGIQLDALNAHGLQANIGVKKTAAILAPTGRGSRKVRQEVFGTGKGKLPVLCEHRSSVKLDAVATYRHLGTILTHNCSMVAEVKSRVAAAWLAFKEGRKTVFCSPCIALVKRIYLFRTYVLSVLLSSSGAWPLLCPTAWRLFEACVTSMARQILRIPHDADQHWSRERIFSEVGLPGAEGLLSLERLRFLSQLSCHGPDAAFAILQNSKPALEAFRSAMDWLVTAVGATSDLTVAGSWDRWQQLFRAKGRFKGILKRASAWHVGRLGAQACFQRFERSIWSAMPAPTAAVELAEHACLLCGIAFFDFQSWASHSARVHGYRSRARRFATGLRCQACGALFATVARYRCHLQSHPVCCRAIEWSVDGLLPPLLGPEGHLQAVSTTGAGTAHLPAIEPDVSAEVLRALKSGRFESDIEIFETLKSFAEPFPVLRRTLAFWASGLDAENVRACANDVLLCMQVDLWCDSASRIPAGPISEDAAFRPLLFPLPLWQVPLAGMAHVVGNDNLLTHADLADFPSTSSTVLDFWQDDVSTPTAGLAVAIPSPPASISCLWTFPSCPLRVMRRHLLWLDRVLFWTGKALSAAQQGRQSRLVFDFSREHAAPLAGWLQQSLSLTQGPAAFAFRFTH